MHAPAVAGHFLHAGDHVCVAGDQHKVGELFADAVDHEVGDQAGIHALLCAALAPLNELAGAQLHAVAGAQRALVAVRARVGDAVVPELAVDGLVELGSDHLAEGCHNLRQVNF